jgi:DNA polymerase beta
MNAVFIHEFNLLIKQIKAEYLNAQMEGNVKDMQQHKYRLQNIKKILSIIKKLDFEITSSSEVEDIPGIGKGSIRRIDEILKTGKLSEIEQKYSEKKHKQIQGIQELTKVIGIGDKFAQKLVTEYKITSVPELEKAYKQGKIELSHQILLGLKYYGVVETNIPRKEITLMNKYLQKEAHKLDPSLEVVICGSYRRGTPTSGDVDVLLYHPDIKTSKYIKTPSYLELFVDELSTEGFIIDNITDKNYRIKYMGFCKYKDQPVRRIDIRMIPYNSIHTAMLYFTGPAELNTQMREKAKRRGMILNEYGLYIDSEAGKKQVKITSEKDVFDHVGMKYLRPEEREKYATGKKL